MIEAQISTAMTTAKKIMNAIHAIDVEQILLAHKL